MFPVGHHRIRPRDGAATTVLPSRRGILRGPDQCKRLGWSVPHNGFTSQLCRAFGSPTRSAVLRDDPVGRVGWSRQTRTGHERYQCAHPEMTRAATTSPASLSAPATWWNCPRLLDSCIVCYGPAVPF